MLNKSTSRSDDVIQSGVAQYPIGFAFQYNGDDTPQIRVTIGDMVAVENKHFVITEDLLNIKLIPLEEEAPADPNDYSWLEKWVGLPLVIERDIPFVQESDYQLGRISPERIEKDFDLSVMRDQILDVKISDVHDEFTEAKAELQKSIDDKLPLAGGEVSGDVLFHGDIKLYDKYHRGATFTTGILGGMYIHTDTHTRFYFDDDFYVSNLEINEESNLGKESFPWSTAYIKKLNNGANILIPEKSGTMALLEDVEGKADKTELENAKTALGDRVEEIESKIPETASATNQLATKADLANVDLDGYVKKSGDTMTGDLVLDVVAGGYTVVFQDSYKNVNTGNVDSVIKRISSSHQTQGLIFSESKNGTVDMQFTMVADGFVMPQGNRLLGSTNYPWNNIYAKKLNNGANIAIPTEGGTLARIEDIPETYTKEELDAKFAEIPDSADTYSKAEIDAKLSSVYKFKGSVANVDALPSGATVGDTYNVEDTGANYAWDGSNWDKLSDTIDLTGYATEEYVDDNTFALMDYINDEVRPLKTDNKNLYNNQLVLRDMLNEKDENEEFIKLTTEAQTAIPAINELKARLDAGAEVGPELDVELKLTSWFYGFNSSDGYFYFDNIYSADSPEDVSCFALTNQVYSGSPNISIVNRSHGISEDGQHYSFTEEWFGPGEYWPKNLGREEAPWQTVYATKLNNGADLELPTEGGTLARIEDIDERIGDISTALTAILGE